MPGYQIPLTTVDANTTINNQKLVTTGFNVGKNLIINGGFDYWQRGIQSSSSDVVGCADRWHQYFSASTGASWSQTVLNPGDVPGLSYGIAVTGSLTDNATGYVMTRHLIEDVRNLAGQIITLSFYAKGSTSGTIGARYFQHPGSGGSSVVHGGGTYIPITTSWQRYSVTWITPSISSYTIGTSSHFAITIDKNLGTNYSNQFGYTGTQINFTGTLYISGAQIEYGANATPFTRSGGSMAGELLNCQRYYNRIGYSSGNTLYFAPGVTISTSRALSNLSLPVVMRVMPSMSNTNLSIMANTSGTNYTVTSLSPYQVSGNQLTVDTSIGSASFSASGNPTILSLTSSNNYIELSAEL